MRAPAQSEFRKGIAAMVKGDLPAAEAAFQRATALDEVRQPSARSRRRGVAWEPGCAERRLRHASVLIGWTSYDRAIQQYAAAELVLKQALALLGS